MEVSVALGNRYAGKSPRKSPAAPRPGFPHFGFGMPTPEAVRLLRARVLADGVELVEQEEEGDYVGFKCLDPDGHVVEVSWEPD